MANLRDIRNRINSVENTRQVTRAMQMVAAAKLRKAQERIFQTRPYAYKMGEIITRLQQQLGEQEASHRLFESREGGNGVLFIVVTADRGLAGAFNSNVIRLTEKRISEDYAEEQRSARLSLFVVGKTGYRYFNRGDYQIADDFRGIFDDLQFEHAQQIVDAAVEGYLDERWDEVYVVYNEFKNTISQNRIVEPLLPIPGEQFKTPIMEEELERPVTLEGGEQVDYIFEPDAAHILEATVPRYLHYLMWRILLESNASEQGARMIAMENATNNAEDLLEDLRLTYNRARQDAITKEILEITSGAEALESAE